MPSNHMGRGQFHKLRQSNPFRAASARFRITIALLVLTTTLGGSSSQGPWNDAVIEIGSLLILLWLSLKSEFFAPPADVPLWAILGVIAAVPLLQLIPLPPLIWQALPGRGVPNAALQMLGRADSWHPLSLYPPLTAGAFLSLIPAVTMAVLASGLTVSERLALFPVVTALALLSAIIGCIQIATGGGAFNFYDFTQPGTSTGLFANRNAQADFLLIGIVCTCFWLAASLRASPQRIRLLIGVGVILVLAAGVLTTASRAGIFLLGMVVLLGGGVLLARKAAAMTLGIAAATGFAGLLFLSQNLVVEHSLDRFQALASDARPGVWRDALFAVTQYWPTGSGMGTFVPVFSGAERLDILGDRYVNRAHNDYLELLLEGGLLSALALIAYAAFMVVRGARLIRRPGSLGQAIPACALVCCGILAAHSICDYPLRNESLLALAALFSGLMGGAPAGRYSRASHKPEEREGVAG